jgi:hypothetical protein
LLFTLKPDAAPAALLALDAAVGGDLFESAVDVGLDAVQPALVAHLLEAVPLLEPLVDVITGAISSRLADTIRSKARDLAERMLLRDTAPGAAVLGDAAGEIVGGVDVDWTSVPTERIDEVGQREGTESARLRTVVDMTEKQVEQALPGRAQELLDENAKLESKIQGLVLDDGLGIVPLDTQPRNRSLRDPLLHGRGLFEPAPSRMTVDRAREIVKRHAELERELAAAKDGRLRIGLSGERHIITEEERWREQFKERAEGMRLEPEFPKPRDFIERVGPRVP